MISKLDFSFVPVTGSLAFPALRLQYLPVSARSSAQKWSILPRRSAGSYAVGCVTTCLNRAAFLDTMYWHRRETANELQATGTSPPNRRSGVTPRTDEGVTKHQGGSAGKLAVRTCAISVGALAVWLISDSMASRTGDTPPRQDLYGSILSVSANAAAAKPAPAAPSPSALISPTPAGIKISAPIKSKKLRATLPTTSRRTRGGWSEAGHFSPRKPAITHAEEYDQMPLLAATQAVPPAYRLPASADSVEWMNHIAQRRVTEIADRFAN